jgi:hypothetical protein
VNGYLRLNNFSITCYIVTCLLKARIAEPGRCLLLGSGSVNMFPQQPNHVTIATDTQQ